MKAAGFYQSTILVNTSAGSVSVPVTLLIAQNPTMTLNPGGSQFQQAAGSTPGNPNGSFLVSVSGSGPVSWSAIHASSERKLADAEHFKWNVHFGQPGHPEFLDQWNGVRARGAGLLRCDSGHFKRRGRFSADVRCDPERGSGSHARTAQSHAGRASVPFERGRGASPADCAGFHQFR